VLTLREHIEPVESERLSALEAGILEEADDLLDDLVDGLDVGLDFATGLERFIEPLTDLLGRLQVLNRSTSGGG
jgi:hypothetical protein